MIALNCMLSPRSPSLFNRLDHAANILGRLQENKLGQKFVVDAQLLCDLQTPGLSDELVDTVDYAAVYKCGNISGLLFRLP